MYKYEMDPTGTVDATEWTRDAGRMDGRMDGVKPIYPPQQLCCVGGIIINSFKNERQRVHWSTPTPLYVKFHKA